MNELIAPRLAGSTTNSYYEEVPCNAYNPICDGNTTCPPDNGNCYCDQVPCPVDTP